MLKCIHLLIGLVLVQGALSVQESSGAPSMSEIVTRFSTCEGLMPALKKADNSIRLSQAAHPSVSNSSYECGELSSNPWSVACNLVNYHTYLSSTSNSTSNSYSSIWDNAVVDCIIMILGLSPWGLLCMAAGVENVVCGDEEPVSAVHYEALTHTLALAHTFKECMYSA